MAVVETEIVFDPVLGARAVKKVVNESSKLGDRIGEEIGEEASKSFRKEVNTGFSRGISSLTSKLVALGATVGAALFSKQAIEASARQQTAINNLEASLARIGEFTPQASQSLQANSKR